MVYKVRNRGCLCQAGVGRKPLLPLVSWQRTEGQAESQVPTEERASDSQWHPMSSCPVGRGGDPSCSSGACRWAFRGFPSALPCGSVCLCVNWAEGSGPGRSAGHAHKQSHRPWAHGTSKGNFARAQPLCHRHLVTSFHRAGERPAFPRTAGPGAGSPRGEGVRFLSWNVS